MNDSERCTPRRIPSEVVLQHCMHHAVLPPAPDVLAAFDKEMEGREYGYEETWDAFMWFRDGWLARSDTASERAEPDTVIAAIIKDIKGRAGLRHAWDDIDVDIRNEIVAEWRRFFVGLPPSEGSL